MEYVIANLMRFAATFAAIFTAIPTCANERLRIGDTVWASLTALERDTLGQRFFVETVPSSKTGVIIDAQAVNESTSGTTGGAQLGGAIASAAYIDNAFRGNPNNWNYSAKGQLGAELVGVLLGSALDSAPVAKFHFRYAIKTLDGNIQHADQIKSDAFRRSVGECVTVPDLTSVGQATCELTTDLIRARYLTIARTADAPTPPNKTKAPPQAENDSKTNSAAQTRQTLADQKEFVLCKYGNTAPIPITLTECQSTEGVAIK